VNRYPNYAIKLLFDQLINQPKEVIGYIRGMIQ
jgi:hypothetical protein